jgi:hypothetical protein
MSERPPPDSHQLHDANTGLGTPANKQTTETTDPTFCPELTPTVITHPGSNNGCSDDFADNTNWTARRTEAPFAFAVLMTERNAA